MNGQKLKYYHLIGLISLVICGICISLNNVFTSQEIKVEENSDRVSPIVPLACAIIVPWFFVSDVMMTKIMVRPEMNFDPSTLTFSVQFFVNIIFLAIGAYIWFWKQLAVFDQWSFIIGFIGSILATIAIVSLHNAFKYGPAGPIDAIVSFNSVILVVLEAFKK